MPSYSTFRRRIAQRGAFEVDAARQGAVHALTSYRSTGRNTEVYGLNECWEIDHTWLNLFVIDNENGLGLGRPRFTAIVDHFSRAVMGFDVDFTGTSAQAALNCLKQAILPKTYLREQYPEVQSDWPSHGVPLILKCDNGAEFHSQSLRQTCFELGIDVAYCPLKNLGTRVASSDFFGLSTNGRSLASLGLQARVSRSDLQATTHRRVP